MSCVSLNCVGTDTHDTEGKRSYLPNISLVVQNNVILSGFEDDPVPPKDAKFDYNSESFRPTSRLKNDFNMSIKSELLNKKLDAESNFAGGSRTGSANSSSNMSKKFNLNSGNGMAKKKQLNPKTDCSYEEELYVSGCTAVWSKGEWMEACLA